MLIIVVALASLLYSLEMPPKGVNCMSLNVPNAERCIVCRNPNSQRPAQPRQKVPAG